VLETTGPKAAHDWHEWAAALPGVVGVEVVFVHWDESEEEVSRDGA
jgi:nitrate reductase NapAB chaperone NapD